MKNVIFLLFITFIPSVLFATVIKGKILDKKGNPLGFAVVFVKGTQNGAIADENGNYQLSVTPGKYTLVCRIAAYHPVEKQVVVYGKEETINFQLKPEILKIAEVTIHANAKDPAYAIMKKVIDKRKYYENLIKTRSVDIYLKGNIKVDRLKSIMGFKISDSDAVDMGLDSTNSGIVYLLEEYSHYTYQAPNKEFNRVISVRESGDPHGLGLATMPPILNIYKNNIDVLGLNHRGFISPANSEAFHYYKFHYLGSFQQYGHTIDKIQVRPKRKYEPCFSGIVYVVEDDWVFQNINLFLTKTAQISGIDTLRLTQTFEPNKKNLWVIQNQVLRFNFRILGIKLKGSFLTVYQNQKINEPVDDSLFSKKIVATYDSLANKRDSAYWAAIRPVPMQKAEKKNFHFKDSVYVAQEKNEDSLSKLPHYRLGLTALLMGNPHFSYKKNTWSMRPLATAVQFNSVEGLSGTLDLKWTHTSSMEKGISKLMTLEWLNRYGFQNHHFNSLIHFGMTYNDLHWQNRAFRWQISFGQYLYQLNGQNPIMPVMNEIYTLFAGSNYLKLYEKKVAEIAFRRNWANGWKADFSLGYERRNALQNSTDYSFNSHHDSRITPNTPLGKTIMPQQDAAILAFSVSYQPGVHYIQNPMQKQPFWTNDPIFKFQYKEGVRAGKATADFANWRFSVLHSLRLRMGGHLIYKLAAGGFLWKNEVNLPDWNHINGNQTFLAGPYNSSFQLAPYYRFSNTAGIYGEGHIEWHLDGLFTNKIPLFRRFNWFLLAGSNTLYINQKNYYAEVFVGLDNIGIGLVRFGRVDFIAGYESGKAKPSLGIRISFSGLLNSLFDTQQGGLDL